MNTAIPSLNSTKQVPPLSALLLVLAALLAIAAWRVLEINPNQIPHDPPTDAVPKELTVSHSSSNSARYQAHRHEAVSLGDGAANARVTQSSNGGRNAKKAVL